MTETAFIANMFVAKFDSAGNALWAHDGQSYFSTTGKSICTGGDGSVYVTGIHEDSAIVFGTFSVPCVGFKDIFLVKYDQNGNVLSAKGAGGLQEDLGNSVCSDKDGNVYLAGSFRNIITIGSLTLSALFNGAGSALIIKYDAAGNVVWVKNSGGFPSSGFSNGISTDAKGNCYVTGYFNSPEIYFDNDTLVNAGINDIFILKYDNIGNMNGAEKAGGSDFDNGNTICTDENGNSYVSGFFKSTNIFFGLTHLYTTNQEVFVAKYDPYGTCLWAVQSDGDVNDVCNSINLNGNDIFIAGEFSSPTCLFGAHALTNSDAFLGSYDLNVAKLSDVTTEVESINLPDQSFSIFPNPFSNSSILRFNNSMNQNVTITIYDSYEKVVDEETSTSNEFLINRLNLESGIYYIRLQTNTDNIANGKFVVQ
jgi:hypothetical protein